MLASWLAAAREIVPSRSIIGSTGVNAKRPIPIATDSETSPARAICHGLTRATWPALGKLDKAVKTGIKPVDQSPLVCGFDKTGFKTVAGQHIGMAYIQLGR